MNVPDVLHGNPGPGIVDEEVPSGWGLELFGGHAGKTGRISAGRAIERTLEAPGNPFSVTGQEEAQHRGRALSQRECEHPFTKSGAMRTGSAGLPGEASPSAPSFNSLRFALG
jgi:hypothetical protein